MEYKDFYDSLMWVSVLERSVKKNSEYDHVPTSRAGFILDNGKFFIEYAAASKAGMYSYKDCYAVYSKDGAKKFFSQPSQAARYIWEERAKDFYMTELKAESVKDTIKKPVVSDTQESVLSLDQFMKTMVPVNKDGAGIDYCEYHFCNGLFVVKEDASSSLDNLKYSVVVQKVDGQSQTFGFATLKHAARFIWARRGMQLRQISPEIIQDFVKKISVMPPNKIRESYKSFEKLQQSVPAAKNFAIIIENVAKLTVGIDVKS